MWLAWKFGAEFLERPECDVMLIGLTSHDSSQLAPYSLSFSGDLFLGTSG
jgi:hypothetical protein